MKKMLTQRIIILKHFVVRKSKLIGKSETMYYKRHLAIFFPERSSLRKKVEKHLVQGH